MQHILLVYIDRKVLLLNFFMTLFKRYITNYTISSNHTEPNPIEISQQAVAIVVSMNSYRHHASRIRVVLIPVVFHEQAVVISNKKAKSLDRHRTEELLVLDVFPHPVELHA